MPCNHSGEIQSCNTFHECLGCRDSFMGSFTNGYCLSCWPIVATARADAIGEAIEAVQRVPALNYAGGSIVRDKTLSALEQLEESNIRKETETPDEAT